MNKRQKKKALKKYNRRYVKYDFNWNAFNSSHSVVYDQMILFAKIRANVDKEIKCTLKQLATQIDAAKLQYSDIPIITARQESN